MKVYVVIEDWDKPNIKIKGVFSETTAEEYVQKQEYPYNYTIKQFYLNNKK